MGCKTSTNETPLPSDPPARLAQAGEVKVNADS